MTAPGAPPPSKSLQQVTSMRPRSPRLVLSLLAALPLCATHAAPAAAAATGTGAARARGIQHVEAFVRAADGRLERRIVSVRIDPVVPRTSVAVVEGTVDGAGSVITRPVHPPALAEGVAR
jgi:hypothetical protein